VIGALARRVDWRESPTLWGPVAWAVSLLWPGAVAGLLMLPPSRPEGRVVLIGLLVAGVGVAAILRLIDWERKRDGTPRTRLGVLGRFLFFGFLFSGVASILAVLIQAILALVGPHGLSQNLAEATSALALGFGLVVASALIGVSWSLWAGLVSSFVAFVPRVESSRPHSFNLQSLADPEPAPRAPRPAPRS
jgi:hypothetical protein